MPDSPKLQLRLFGPFAVSWAGGNLIEIRSAKQQALLVLLATAADGIRTRSWLQDMLWSRAGSEHGRASLRQALRALRIVFENRFDAMFDVSQQSLRLRREAFELVGSRRDGEFLEGIDIQEDGFEDWLRQQRANPPALSPDAGLTGESERILPSVAVLPFLTLQDDHYDGMLGDAVAQEVTRALSRSGLLSIVSHLSCRSVNTRSVALDDLRAALDVDYVVCGSLRIDGDAIRIDIDFVDALTGRVRWTRSFRGALPDFLRGDDTMTTDMAKQIGRAILSASVELASTRPLPDVESHALMMSGISLMHHQSLASFAKAREQIEEVIRRAPRHSTPHAWLGNWHILSAQQGWSVDLAADTQIACDCTARALDLNPECPFSLTIDGFAHNNMLKRLEEAGARYDEALEIEPNCALAWLLKGTLLAFVDRGAEAVALTSRARALSPLDPYSYFYDSLSATACAAAGDYEGALALAERSLGENRRHSSTLRVRTAALQLLGRHEEARASAAELMRREPTLTIRSYLAKHPAADFRTGKEWARALLSAGVPDV